LNRTIDLDDVPVADNFRVEVLDRHLEMTSNNRRIAWFPAWENADRDLRHFVPADVPLGTLEEPFEDADEAWRIMIFEEGGWIYILEADAPRSTEFPRRWRVKRDKYLEAWARVISEFNPVLDLDDLLGEADA
jgi:hypothetical protein